MEKILYLLPKLENCQKMEVNLFNVVVAWGLTELKPHSVRISPLL